MAQLKRKLILKNISSNGRTIHTCPLIKLQYWGNCANFTCPANTSQMNPANNGGCFLLLGKPTIIDASSLLKITTHEVKRRYRRGMQRISKFLQFYQWLQEFREQPIQPHCQQCGIVLIHGKFCINRSRCLRRQKLLQRAKNMLPLRINTLLIQPYEFWQITSAQTAGKFTILPTKLLVRATNLLSRLSPQETKHADQPRKTAASQPNAIK